MEAYCYILFSEILNKFYIGVTSDNPEERLIKHLNKSYGTDTFTAAANDWTIYLSIECLDMAHALKIEKHIKRMKSKQYILNLKKYPEIIDKLIAKYKN